MKHPLAWLIWALAAAASALILRNPLYLTLLLLAVWANYAAVEHAATQGQSWRTLLKVGALIWALTIPFNALMLHQGEIVLFRLPAHWPLIGGKVTLEAVAVGFVSGYSLWVLLGVFAVFNLAVDASQLLRYTPNFLEQAGVIIAIALTFIPQMIASLQEIREAQRIRGHSFRRWRDQLPLVMPLLTTALEHAIQLAESMEARGFGAGQADEQSHLGQAQWLIVPGLGLLLSGLVLRALAPTPTYRFALLLGAGAWLLLYAFWRLSRRTLRSRYRRMAWCPHDTLGVCVSGLVLGGVVALRWVRGDSLGYYPFAPGALLPTFEPRIGLLIALLSLPGLILLLSETRTNRAPSGGVA